MRGYARQSDRIPLTCDTRFGAGLFVGFLVGMAVCLAIAAVMVP